MAELATGSVDDMVVMLASIHTESGVSLLALTEASPVLLVFLRHFGCPFCRKAISDVADLQQELADRGVRPVFVHLGTPRSPRRTLTITDSVAWSASAIRLVRSTSIRYLRCDGIIGCCRR